MRRFFSSAEFELVLIIGLAVLAFGRADAQEETCDEMYEWVSKGVFLTSHRNPKEINGLEYDFPSQNYALDNDFFMVTFYPPQFFGTVIMEIRRVDDYLTREGARELTYGCEDKLMSFRLAVMTQ